jgi:hypothetical protein
MDDLRAMYEKTLEFAKAHFNDIAGDDAPRHATTNKFDFKTKMEK